MRRLLWMAALVVASCGQASSQPNSSEAASALRAASAAMAQRLAVPPSGDPDRDFAAGLIAAHQNAIDLARIELQYGQDPTLRAAAEATIRAGTASMAELLRWQESRSGAK